MPPKTARVLPDRVKEQIELMKIGEEAPEVISWSRVRSHKEGRRFWTVITKRSMLDRVDPHMPHETHSLDEYRLTLYMDDGEVVRSMTSIVLDSIHTTKVVKPKPPNGRLF